MEPYGVILVVDRGFGPRLQELPEGTPTWVVDSAANRPAIEAYRKSKKMGNHLTGLTSFTDFPQLSPAELAAEMMATIEEHHGVFSHTPAFSQLRVLGATIDPVLTAASEEIGFHLDSATAASLDFSRTG